MVGYTPEPVRSMNDHQDVRTDVDQKSQEQYNANDMMATSRPLNGQNEPGFHRPLMETKNIPCVFFARGECKHGDNCRFSHDFDPTALPKTDALHIDPSTQAEPSQDSLREVMHLQNPLGGAMPSSRYDQNGYHGMDAYEGFGAGRMVPSFTPHSAQNHSSMASGDGQSPGLSEVSSPMYPQMHSYMQQNDAGGLGMRGESMTPFMTPPNPFVYGYPEVAMLPGQTRSGIYPEGNTHDGTKGRMDSKSFNMMHYPGHGMDPRFNYGINGNGPMMNGHQYPQRMSRASFAQHSFNGPAQYGHQTSQLPMGNTPGQMNGYHSSMDTSSLPYSSSSRSTSRSQRSDLPSDVCVFFMQGASKCRNGANCGFIHPVPMLSAEVNKVVGGDVISPDSGDAAQTLVANHHESDKQGQQQGNAPHGNVEIAREAHSDTGEPEVILNGVPCIDVRGRGAWKKFSRSSGHGNHHGGSMSHGNGRVYGVNGQHRRGWQYGQGNYEKVRNGMDEDHNESARIDISDLPQNPTHRREDGSALSNGVRPNHHGPNGKRHSTSINGIGSVPGRKRMPSNQMNGTVPVAQAPARLFNADSEVDFPALPRKGPSTYPGTAGSDRGDESLATRPVRNSIDSGHTTTAAEVAAAAAELPQPHFRPFVQKKANPPEATQSGDLSDGVASMSLQSAEEPNVVDQVEKRPHAG